MTNLDPYWAYIDYSIPRRILIFYRKNPLVLEEKTPISHLSRIKTPINYLYA